LGFVLTIVSAFMTWSDNPPFSDTGFERAGGVFALVVSIGAAVILMLDRRPRGAIIAISGSALVLIAVVVELLNIGSSAASTGSGVYLALVGAIIATVASGLLTFGLFKKPGA
jgi:hypothetical protein